MLPKKKNCRECFCATDGMMLILNTRLNTKYSVRSVLGTTSSWLKLRVDGKVSTGNLALRKTRQWRCIERLLP